MRSTSDTGDTAVTTVRLPARDLERLKEIAGAEYRTVAQELRRLVHQRIQQADGETTSDTPEAA